MLGAAVTQAYEEIIDFLAGGCTPDALIAYQPSEDTKRRVDRLIRREKNEGLTREETSELNHFMELDHILTLAKARARVRQSNG
jgi:hypothetical protein